MMFRHVHCKLKIPSKNLCAVGSSVYQHKNLQKLFYGRGKSITVELQCNVHLCLWPCNITVYITLSTMYAEFRGSVVWATDSKWNKFHDAIMLAIWNNFSFAIRATSIMRTIWSIKTELAHITIFTFHCCNSHAIAIL